MPQSSMKVNVRVTNRAAEQRESVDRESTLTLRATSLQPSMAVGTSSGRASPHWRVVSAGMELASMSGAVVSWNSTTWA